VRPRQQKQSAAQRRPRERNRLLLTRVQLVVMRLLRFSRLELSARSTSCSASRSEMFLTCATSLTMKYLARSYIFFSRNERLFLWLTRRRFLSTSATSVNRPVFILSRFCL